MVERSNSSVVHYLPWVWTGVVAVAIVGLLVRDIGDPDAAFDVANAIPSIAAILLFALMGSLVAIRAPRNPIGWLLLVAGTAMVSFVVIEPILPDDAAPVGSGFVEYLAIVLEMNAGLSFLMYPMFLIAFLFPTGRFLSRGWSWPGWLGAVFVPGILLLSIFTDEIGPAFGEWTIENPIGLIPTSVLDLVSSVWVGSLFVMAPATVLSLVLRYRRSAVVERAQIRWILLGALLFALAFFFISSGFLADTVLGGVLTAIGFAAVPVSVTIAITKYRLYEIDRLISRTIGYVLVLGLLGGVYLLGAAWLPTQVLDEQPPLFVAGSTLAVVALFNPLRKRILGWVDRRFYRSRYRAEQVVASFSERVRDEVAVDGLAAEWQSAVVESLQPSSIEVWVLGGPE